MVVCNLQVTRHHEEQRTRTTGQHAGLGEVSPANGALGAVADGDVAEHVTANDEAETQEHVELDKRVVWYVPHAGSLQLERGHFTWLLEHNTSCCIYSKIKIKVETLLKKE